MKSAKFNARGSDFQFAEGILTLRGEIAIQEPPAKMPAPKQDTQTLVFAGMFDQLTISK